MLLIFNKGQIGLQTGNAPLLPYYNIILLIFLMNLLKDLLLVTAIFLVLKVVLMEHITIGLKFSIVLEEKTEH